MTQNNLFNRLKQGLSKTRGMVTSELQETELDTSKSVDEFITEVEDGLLMADVGIETTQKIITRLDAEIKGQGKVLNILVTAEALERVPEG